MLKIQLSKILLTCKLYHFMVNYINIYLVSFVVLSNNLVTVRLFALLQVTQG
jgi:hypothetical protein